MRWHTVFSAVVVLVLSACAGGAVYLLAGCRLTIQDRGELAQYEGQQGACIAASPHDRAAIDACRARVKADWCQQWKARFDAGVCP